MSLKHLGQVQGLLDLKQAILRSFICTGRD